MPSRKDDIKFLHQYLQGLREWYEKSDWLIPSDLHEPSEKQRTECEATEERVARLADANGFDGSLFRQYLLEGSDHDPLSLQSLHQTRRKIETVPRIIVKLEESEQDENTSPSDDSEPAVQLTKDQIKVLTHLAEIPEECRNRADIAADVEPSESTLKHLLPTLEEMGLIHRPHGPRKGYAITLKGRRLIETSSSQLPHAVD